MEIIPKPLPALAFLQDLFEVSHESPSGLIWRSSRSNRIKIGQVAGTIRPGGYWAVCLKTDKSRFYYTHRICFYLQTGIDPKNLDVDHMFSVNDNINLRTATRRENLWNQKKKLTFGDKLCSSKFKGVSWYKKNKKWEAYIKLGCKKVRLGYFNDEISAAIAYNKAAIEYFGEFARINEVALPKQ